MPKRGDFVKVTQDLSEEVGGYLDFAYGWVIKIDDGDDKYPYWMAMCVGGYPTDDGIDYNWVHAVEVLTEEDECRVIAEAALTGQPYCTREDYEELRNQDA